MATIRFMGRNACRTYTKLISTKAGDYPLFVRSQREVPIAANTSGFGSFKSSQLRWFVAAPSVRAPSPPQNRRRDNQSRKRSIDERVSRLAASSDEFGLRHHEMSESHRGRQLFELLLQWSSLMKALVQRPELLLRAAHCADALAHILLDSMEQSAVKVVASSSRNPPRSHANRSIVPVNFISVAVHAWAKVQHVDRHHATAAQCAEALLVRLLELQGQRGTKLEVYNGVIDAWSKSPSAEAPEKALHWLRLLQDEEQQHTPAPDLLSYNGALNALANRGDTYRTMKLLEEMKHAPMKQQQPDAYTYSIAMKAWQKSNHPQAFKQVQLLLEDLTDRYRKDPQPHLLPSAFVYGVAIKMAPSPCEAQRLLEDMIAWWERDAAIQPSIQNFVMCMTKWARVGQPKKVEQLLLLMEQLYESGCQQLRPNYQCLSVVLSAWAKQRTNESIQHAESILYRMEELFLDSNLPSYHMNAYGYNLLMNAYVHSEIEGVVQHVQRIFDRMSVLGRKHRDLDMRPDKVSYSILTQALINESAPGFAEKVEALLETMKERYQCERRDSLKPDVYNYAAVLNAWSKSDAPQAVDRAEALMQEMLGLSGNEEPGRIQPNSVCFNSLINIHACRGNARRAEEVLGLMEGEYEKGNKSAKPNVTSFTTCIDAWTQSEAPNRTEEAQVLLRRLVKRYKNGERDCKPTGKTFVAFAMVVAKAIETEEKLRLLRELQSLAEEIGIQHCAITCNAVLHACSTMVGDESTRNDALELAVTTFHKMHNEGIEKDSITYNSLLRCMNRLIPDPDDCMHAMADVFRKCCEDGKVDDTILRQLSLCLSPQFIQSLVSSDAIDESGEISLERLPLEWRQTIAKSS